MSDRTRPIAPARSSTLQLPGVETLLRGAELETAHSDWRTDHTGEPFEALSILLEDLNNAASLNAIGIRRMYRRLHESLCARLKYIADRKRYPGIAAERIEAPIFILGLPRSGTTFLHNLLGSDPANRAPRLFEMLFPAPKSSQPLAAQLREQLCRESLTDLGFMDEDWLGVHPMGAERAEECIFIWELSLLSVTYPALAEVPNYQAHVFSRDFLAIYREQRDFLKYLQHGAQRRRWILKTPIHVRFLEQILQVFPDACFVHCHRDTAKVYPSIANMAAVLHSKYADIPPGEGAVVGDYDGTWADALEFRRRPGMAERFVDVKFLEFQADPIGTVGRIYAALGIDFPEGRRAAMAGWLAEDSRARSNRRHHQYTLADVGLTVAEIDRMTGDYLKAFDVPLER